MLKILKFLNNFILMKETYPVVANEVRNPMDILFHDIHVYFLI